MEKYSQRLVTCQRKARTRCGIKSAKNRGAALIVTVSLLAVLSLLAVSFTQMSIVDSQATRNFREEKQAELFAHAGVEYAISHLKAVIIKTAYTDYKEDWVWKDVWTTSVEKTLYPSLKKGELRIGTQTPHHKMAYSCDGSLLPAEIAKKGYFTLKICNSNARINLNDRNNNLNIILASLAEFAGFASQAQEIAEKILSQRHSGYTSLNELQTRDILTREQFVKLAPYFTIGSWQNHKAIRPGSFDRNIFEPKEWIETRSPIDLNSAPEAILFAVLSGISGEGRSGNIVQVPPETAKKLAKKIVENRENNNSFPTWSHWQEFLLKLAPQEEAETTEEENLLTREQAELIYVHSNPNSHLNDLNPDSNHYYDIDKLDILTYTTEFCLGPMGIFEIDSIGRVIEQAGEINREVAHSKVFTRVKLFDIYQTKVQKDVEKARGEISPNTSSLVKSFPFRVEVGDSENAHPFLGSSFRGNPYSWKYGDNAPEKNRYADGVYTSKDAILTHAPPQSIESGPMHFLYKPTDLDHQAQNWIVFAVNDLSPLALVTEIFYQNEQLRVCRSLTAKYGESYQPGRDHIRIFRDYPIHYDMMEKLYQRGELEYMKNLMPFVKVDYPYVYVNKPHEEGKRRFAEKFRKETFARIRNGDPSFDKFIAEMLYIKEKWKIEWDGDLKLIWRKEKTKTATVNIDATVYSLIFKSGWDPQPYEEVHWSSGSPGRYKQIEFEDVQIPMGSLHFFKHPYRYSRFESQVDIKLQPREWYSIKIDWQGVKITSVHVAKHNPEKENNTPVELTPQGEQQDVIIRSSGPLNVQRVAENYPEGTEFRMPGTVYNSQLASGKEYADRYKGTLLEGKITLDPTKRYHHGIMLYWTERESPASQIFAQARLNNGQWKDDMDTADGKNQEDFGYGEKITTVEYRFHFAGGNQYSPFRSALLQDITVNAFVNREHLVYRIER